MNINRYIANSLTLSRFFLAVPLVIALSLDQLLLSLTFLILGAITDLLDGYFARRSNSKSKWGSMYDPFADKVLLLGPLLWLVANDIVPFWSVFIILVRDLFITTKRQSDVIGSPAIILAKVKTSLLFTSILLLLTPESYYSLNYPITITITDLGLILYWTSLIISILTGIKYINTK